MIEKTVRHLYGLLIDKKYNDAESFTSGVRMTAIEIEECIQEYGCVLVPYPQQIELDIIEVRGRNPKEWSVVAPIYTSEEGLSDLGLEISLIESSPVFFKIELDNIRVR